MPDYGLDTLSREDLLGPAKAPAPVAATPAAPKAPAVDYGLGAMSTQDLLGGPVDPTAEAEKAAALFEASFKDPTEEVKRRNLSKSIEKLTGIFTPAPVMDVKDSERTFRLHEADHATRASPRTSAFLSIQENADVAMQDAKTLAQIEKIVGRVDLARSGEIIAKNMAVAPGGIGAWIADLYAMPFDFLGAGAAAAGVPADYNFFSQRAAESRRGATDVRQGMDYLTPTPENIYEKGLAAGSRSAAQSLMLAPATAAAMAAKLEGVAATGPAIKEAAMSAANVIAGTFGVGTLGESFTEAREQGKGVLAAAGYAIPQGAFEYVFETAPARVLAEAIQSAPGLKAFVWGLLKTEVPMEQLTTLSHNFTRWVNFSPEKPVAEFLAEQPEAMAETFIATLVGAGLQAGAIHTTQRATGYFAQKQEERRIEQQQQLLTDLFDQAKQIKADPVTFQNFMAGVTDNATVFINADALQDTLAQNKMDVSVLPSLAEQLAQPSVTGDVEVPIGELMTAFAGTPAQEQVVQHARVRQDDLSAAEQAQFGDMGAFFKKQGEAVMEKQKANEAFVSERQEIEADIVKQLGAASPFQEREHRYYAQMMGAFYATAADLMGTTPKQIQARWAPKILGATEAAQPGTLTQGFDHGNAMLNVGLDVGATDRAQKIDADFVKAEIEKMGVQVLSAEQVEGEYEYEGKPVKELTYVPHLSRPLTEAEVNQLAIATGQEAIGHYADGTGNLWGPNAANWGDFNPEFFKDQRGTKLSDARKELAQSQSTRRPTTKRAAEDHLGEVSLVVDYTKIEPEKTEQNMKLVSQYPGIRFKARKADGRAEEFIQHVTANLLWLHDQIPAEIRQRSKLWYDGARAITDRWSAKYGKTDAQIAAILAVYSPQRDWFMNVSLAERTLDIVANQQDTAWSPEMTEVADKILADEKFSMLRGAIEGKKLSELKDRLEQAAWLRTFDEAHNNRGHRLVTPEGGFIEFAVSTKNVEKKTGWPGFGTIIKALYVIDDGSPKMIDNALGGEHKVRSFYNNIFHPTSDQGFVTIDTHAVAAGLLRPLSGNSVEVAHNFGGAGTAASAATGMSGTYAYYQEAYRRAAGARGLLPREMQSITWEAVRELYTMGFKHDTAKMAVVDKLWSEYEKGKRDLDSVRAGILNLAGGVEQPSWVNRDSGISPEGWASTYTGELLGDSVPGRDAGGVDAGARERAAAGISGSELAQLNRNVGAVAGPVVGIHFSQQPRDILASSMWGTGMKGAEGDYVRASADKRLRHRIAFYVNTGNGIMPESGVGGQAHAATLTNLYDADADALKIWRNNPDERARESAVLDAGFDGFLTRSFGKQGAVVLLGERAVQVEHMGGYARSAWDIPKALQTAAIAAGNAVNTGKHINDLQSGFNNASPEAQAATLAKILEGFGKPNDAKTVAGFLEGRTGTEALAAILAEQDVRKMVQDRATVVPSPEIPKMKQATMAIMQNRSLINGRQSVESWRRDIERSDPDTAALIAWDKIPAGDYYKDQIAGQLWQTTFKPVDTESAEFKAWANNAPIKSEGFKTGEAVVIRGQHASTYGDITEFQKKEQRFGKAGYGFYFSNAAGANLFAEYGDQFQMPRSAAGEEKAVKTYPVFIAMQNPLVVDHVDDLKPYIDQGQKFGVARGVFGNLSPEALTKLQEQGYDGIIARETTAPKVHKTRGLKILDRNDPKAVSFPVFVAFEPTQIKSAISNTGEFSDTNPSILFAEAAGPRRGSFNPLTFDLRLLADANRSTFIHEASHFFMAAYIDMASQPDAPPALKQYVEDLLGYLFKNVPGGEQVGGDGLGQKVGAGETAITPAERAADVAAEKAMRALSEFKHKHAAYFEFAHRKNPDGKPYPVDRALDSEATRLHQQAIRLNKVAADLEYAARGQRREDPSVLHQGRNSIMPDDIRTNPSADRLVAMLRKSGDKTLRYVVDEAGDFHFWDAFLATHKAGSEAAGVPYDYTRRGLVKLIDDAYAYFSYADLGVPTESLRRYMSGDKTMFSQWGEEYTGAEMASILDKESDALLRELLAQDGEPATPGAIPEGRTNIERWNAMTLDQQRAYWEFFAEGWEQYAMSGKAPTKALQSAFSAFAKWMKEIYKTLKNFVTMHGTKPLDAELTQYFDRMLATDEELEAARAERGFQTLFKNLAESGMSPGQFADYMALDALQKTEAEELLRSRSIRDMKWLSNAKSKAIKEIQAEADELRNLVRAGVEEELANTPIRQAERWLRKGEMVQDGEQIKATAGHRLDISVIREMFPENSLGNNIDFAKLGKGSNALAASTGTQHPDDVAKIFGFRSGEHLVRELLAMPAFKDEVSHLTDLRMLEEHGDLATPEAIEKAADEAIHNDAHLKMVATEVWALTNRTGSVAMLTKAAKAFAANLVDNTVVKKLSPVQFVNAATRAGKAAVRAMAKKDTDKAASEKRVEMVNAAAAKEAYAAEAEVRAIMTRLRKIAAYSDKHSSITSREFGVVQAVRAILAEFSIGSHGEKATKYLKTLSEYDPTLGAVLDGVIEQLAPEAKPWSELKVADLRELHAAVTGLWRVAKEVRSVELAGEKMSLDDARAQLIAKLEEQSNAGRDSRAFSLTDAEIRNQDFQSYAAKAIRPENWVSMKDGLDEYGPWRRLIWNTIDRAQLDYNADKGEKLKQLKALLVPIMADMTDIQIDAPELGGSFGAGSVIGYSELLHAILHTGNTSNKTKLLVGRGWGSLREDGSVDSSKWDAFMKRMWAEGKITKTHMDFVQGVWDLLESMKEGAQKAHRTTTGRYFEEIEAAEIVTPFGVYRGGYAPAIVDRRQVADMDIRKLQEAAEMDVVHSFDKPAGGFTKSRVQNYNQKLELNIAALGRHIDQVLLFSHMSGPVRNVQRVLKGKDLSNALAEADRAAMAHVLAPWLHSAATQVVTEKGKLSYENMTLFTKLRSRAGMALMFANVSNSLQQLTSFFPAMLEVGKKDLLFAAAKGWYKPREMAASIAAMSPYMKQRLDNEVHAMAEEIDQILLNPTKFEKAQDWAVAHSYFLQMAVDTVMSPIIWQAKFNEATARGAEKQEAIDLADSAVRKSQGSNRAIDIAAMEKGSPFYRMFMQFAGYFNSQINLIGEKLARERMLPKTPAKYGRIAMILAQGWWAPAIASMAIALAMRGGPDDEDGDGLWDDWLTELLLGTVKYATAAVPVFGQAINATVNAFNDKPYDDRMSLSPAVSLIDASIRGGQAAVKSLDDPTKAGRAVRDLGSFLSLFGVPVTPITKAVGYATDVETGKVNPTSGADYARGIVTGVASPESK